MNSFPDYIGSALYGVCALVALLPVRDKLRHSRPGKTVWIVVALFLLALVPIRLLGLEELSRDVLRTMFTDGFAYDERRGWQAPLAAIGVAVAALAMGALALRQGGDLHRPSTMALVGAGALAGLYLLRILSFHPIDRMIYAGIGPIRMNYLLELACLALVAFASWRYFNHPQRKHRLHRR